MFRSTRSITLVLISTGLAALGFGLWDQSGHAVSTTQPAGSSGGSWHWSAGRSYSGGHSSSYSSGTSRGGFGSTGHAVSS
jgi:hypothetical protein